jgi:hypothetical protein
MKDKLTSLIAGPTDRTKIFRFAGMTPEQYDSHLSKLADVLVNHLQLVNIIPDQGVPLDLACKLREKGVRTVGYVPHGGCGGLGDNFQYCDEVREFDKGWSGLNTCLSLRGDIVLVTGMSPGTIIEVAYTRYHKAYLKKDLPILADRRLAPCKIPTSIIEDLNLTYFSDESQLDLELKKIRGWKDERR